MQYEQLLLAVGMKRLVFGRDGFYSSSDTREDHAPWLHILRPASYDEDDDRDTEWRGVSGKIGDVDDKVEGLEDQMTALDQNMNGKVEGLEKQVTSLDQKMDNKVEGLEKQMATLLDQKMGDKIGTLDNKIDALDQKICSLDQKMDSILFLLQK
jgi:phage shock protein A